MNTVQKIRKKIGRNFTPVNRKKKRPIPGDQTLDFVGQCGISWQPEQQPEPPP